MLEMKPGRCTHVIAADVLDKTSRKVMAAQGSALLIERQFSGPLSSLLLSEHPKKLYKHFEALLLHCREEFKHRIKVVNTAWLYDCARNWDILPAGKTDQCFFSKGKC